MFNKPQKLGHRCYRTPQVSALKVGRLVGRLVDRVSKSSRHTDVRLHKTFHNLRKILALECKTVKITALFLCFMEFLAHFHAQFLWLDILSVQ